MHLRHNKILKLFALLIFSLELIASVAFTSTAASERIPQSEKIAIEGCANHGINFIASLFCEETGEEERETKGAPILDFIEIFSIAEQFAVIEFESLTVRITNSVVRFSSQPARFKRICTLVI